MDLLAARFAAHYLHNTQGHITAVNQFDGGHVPAFHLQRPIDGGTAPAWRTRADLEPHVAHELGRFAQREPPARVDTHRPRFQKEYRQLLEAVTTADDRHEWLGPAYELSTGVQPTQIETIDESNSELLQRHLEDWVPDAGQRHPFVASVVQRHAVAVCASVRIGPELHEAGVETAPAFRRQGHALAAVAAWAISVDELGAIPIYSTSMDNAASQHLAARLGGALFAIDYRLG